MLLTADLSLQDMLFGGWVGGYCYQQNSALKTFVGGVIPVDM